LAYSDAEAVSLNVGFYYMANAAGRLLGTLLSGGLFLVGGMQACLWASFLPVGLVPAGGLGLSGRVALATAPAAEVVASLSGWLPALETSMAGCNLLHQACGTPRNSTNGLQ
jgi:hypothetical protein